MRRARTLAWVLVAAVALCVVAEVVARALGEPSPYTLDEKLGWRLKKGFSHAYSRRDASGDAYVAAFQTDSNGLRVHGTDAADAVKVLVVGDSYTAHPFAGNAQMWYAVMADGLAKRLGRPVLVAAAGGGGYGTYQELLLAREASTFFRPDLVILQFCLNDFGNNHKAWEAQSIVRSQYLRRPYLAADGGAEFHDGLLARIYRSPVPGESKLFTTLDAAAQLVQYKLYGGYFPPSVAEAEGRYEAESIELTGRLLADLRRVFERVPYLVVNCSASEEGPNRKWQDLARTAGMVPVTAPLEAIDQAKKAGKVVFAADGAHFSPLGNSIYGNALVAPAEVALKSGS